MKNTSQLLGPTVFENQQWRVASNGLESLKTPWDDGGYFISAERLLEQDGSWIPHLAEKIWCDPVLFVDAFYAACELLLGMKFKRDCRVVLANSFAAHILRSNELYHLWRFGTTAEGGSITSIADVFLQQRSELYSIVEIASEHSGHLQRVPLL